MAAPLAPSRFRIASVPSDTKRSRPQTAAPAVRLAGRSSPRRATPAWGGICAHTSPPKPHAQGRHRYRFGPIDGVRRRPASVTSAQKTRRASGRPAARSGPRRNVKQPGTPKRRVWRGQCGPARPARRKGRGRLRPSGRKGGVCTPQLIGPQALARRPMGSRKRLKANGGSREFTKRSPSFDHRGPGILAAGHHMKAYRSDGIAGCLFHGRTPWHVASSSL